MVCLEGNRFVYSAYPILALFLYVSFLDCALVLYQACTSQETESRFSI